MSGFAEDVKVAASVITMGSFTLTRAKAVAVVHKMSRIRKYLISKPRNVVLAVKDEDFAVY